MSIWTFRFIRVPALSLAVAALFCVGDPARGQSTAPQDNRPIQDNTTRNELMQFNQFLDNHPEIAEQVRKDPSLVDNVDFVRNHPALQKYLQDNAEVRETLRQDPNSFLRTGDRVDNRFDDQRDRDVTRRDLDEFNRFLDAHPETAEQLRRNPSLVDDPNFVRNHPELQTYLHDNPGVRQELAQDPNAFMRDEDRPDRREDGRDYSAPRRDLADFDRFLDNHPEISEQLRKDPSLADNREFVQNHPALQSYLQNNSAVRDQLRQDPNAFMREEDRFDRPSEARYRDPAHEHMASFGEFLGGHAKIADDVSRDPNLVKNHDYIDNHRDLGEYLHAHPEVRNEWAANPEGFVKGAQQFKNGTGQGSSSGSGSGSVNTSGHPGMTTGAPSNGGPTAAPNPAPAQPPKPKQ